MWPAVGVFNIYLLFGSMLNVRFPKVEFVVKVSLGGGQLSVLFTVQVSVLSDVPLL